MIIPPPAIAGPDAAVAHAPFRPSLLPRTTRLIHAAWPLPQPRVRPSSLPARVSERPRPRAVRSDWLHRGGGRPVGAHTLPAQPMGVRASLTRRPASRQPLNKPHCCTKLQRRSPGPPLAPACHRAEKIRGREQRACEPERSCRPSGAKLLFFSS